MEASESKPAPALGAALKEKDRAQPEVLESGKEKGKSASDRSTIGRTAVYKSTPTRLTLRVRDVREAVKKTLDLLQQIGAKNVHQESTPETEIITAAMASPTIPNLLDQLKTLGEVQGKGLSPPTPEEPVSDSNRNPSPYALTTGKDRASNTCKCGSSEASPPSPKAVGEYRRTWCGRHISCKKNQVLPVILHPPLFKNRMISNANCWLLDVS